MGYRSEVAYTIRFDSKETLNEFIALVMAKGGYEVEALRECNIYVKDEPKDYRVSFYADYVKWYDDYDDVKSHHWLMDFAEERFDSKVGYRFIRIGEDIEDIEDVYGGDNDLIDWDLTIQRNIELSFNIKPIGEALSVIA